MRVATILSLLALLTAFEALAEKADANKATDIKADQMAFDDVKQISSFTGNVVMQRGTLLMKAGKAVITQDPSGYQFSTLQAGAGGMASFRQKRDGGDLWVEGQADRIEYDDKSELVKFFSRAKLKRLQGKQVTDEVTGEVIIYDSRSEIFTVQNANNAKDSSTSKRINTVIQPRNRSEAEGAKE